MCTNKVLYKAGDLSHVVRLEKRQRGGKLTFRQICLTTDYIRAYADKEKKSIADAVRDLKSVDGTFSYIYRAARKSSSVPHEEVVRNLQKIMSGKV
jgi:hypothetical protein